jgi:carboxylesterase type B
LTYLFDQPGRPVDFDGNVIALTDRQRSVASDMVAAWTSFARSGRPSVRGRAWPEWSSGRVRVISDEPDSHETVGPVLEHHCAFWRGIDLEP